MNIQTIKADYNNSQHAQAIVFLLNAYAIDPMGGGEALSPKVKQNLVSNMANRDHVFSFICYVDDKPAALLNCVEGFSTFNASPLMNIHDVTVLPEFRGLSLSEKLFEAVELLANERGCCKLTLEVLEGNTIAKNAYTKYGYSGYELDPEMGQAIFWQKKLS